MEKEFNISEVTVTPEFKLSGVVNQALSMMDNIRNMDVSETISYPIAKVSSARSLSSQVGMELNRKYKTRADRDRRVVWVTRIS